MYIVHTYTWQNFPVFAFSFAKIIFAKECFKEKHESDNLIYVDKIQDFGENCHI